LAQALEQEVMMSFHRDVQLGLTGWAFHIDDGSAAEEGSNACSVTRLPALHKEKSKHYSHDLWIKEHLTKQQIMDLNCPSAFEDQCNATT
jgi:hypothetical protein